ncbi:glutamine synthetase family protein [Lacisediminihabitans profunda]|nr:glutamine synthetase family protein [Lacisediminihabitans profunda]
MLEAERGGFIDRHDLWTESQYASAAQMRRVMDEVGIEMVRFCFVDQHGVIRGKTLTRASVAAALRSGVTAPSSLLLKDSAGKSVYAVFESDTVSNVDGFSGAGDIVMVPDPGTFRVLPWSRRTGMVLCDVRFPNGAEVPFCTRSILRREVKKLAERDLALTVGAELEFHVFRLADSLLADSRVGRPGQPGLPVAVHPTTSGSQLLHDESLDTLDELVQELYSGLTLMDLPLRSIELEFGPNQLEITMEAGDASAVADAVVFARTAIRQICRRLGYHATFMSRPVGAETASTGWHLHQSMRRLSSGENVFVPCAGDAALSPVGMHYLAGLLAHAAASASFATPTVNGYKRYQPYSLAPDRVLWGIDNKGAMVRAVCAVGDPASRLENRSGEPGANPYLYIASQIVSGLDGIDRQLEAGPPTENPYQDDAERLPSTLGEALGALELDPVFGEAFGDRVIEWYLKIKRSEYARYLAHVSDWEQREYFGML